MEKTDFDKESNKDNQTQIEMNNDDLQSIKSTDDTNDILNRIETIESKLESAEPDKLHVIDKIESLENTLKIMEIQKLDFLNTVDNLKKQTEKEKLEKNQLLNKIQTLEDNTLLLINGLNLSKQIMDLSNLIEIEKNTTQNNIQSLVNKSDLNQNNMLYQINILKQKLEDFFSYNQIFTKDEIN